MRDLTDGSALFFPRIANVVDSAKLTLRYSNGSASKGTLEVRQNDQKGKLLGTVSLSPTGSWDEYKQIEIPLAQTNKQMNLCFQFVGPQGEWARLDRWQM